MVAVQRVRRWDGKFGFGGWLMRARFQDFQVEGLPGKDCRLEALNASTDWCHVVHQHWKGQLEPEIGVGLVLTGGYGTGKTHLVAGAANYLREKGIPTAFANVPEVLDWLRGTYQNNSEDNYSDEFDALKNASVLILDDLGAQHETSWATEKLYQLINWRLVMELPLAITSNTPVKEMDARLRSRIGGANMVVVDTGRFDYRQVERDG